MQAPSCKQPRTNKKYLSISPAHVWQTKYLHFDLLTYQPVPVSAARHGQNVKHAVISSDRSLTSSAHCLIEVDEMGEEFSPHTPLAERCCTQHTVCTTFIVRYAVRFCCLCSCCRELPSKYCLFTDVSDETFQTERSILRPPKSISSEMSQHCCKTLNRRISPLHSLSLGVCYRLEIPSGSCR